MRLTPCIIGTILAATLLSGVSFAAEGPVFDAASVKLTGPEVRQPYIITGGPGTSDPGRFHAPRIQLFNLLPRAFGVSTDQLSGPPWLRDVVPANNFTVIAIMPPDTTKEQFQQMLQNLLVERFHLVFHRETRNFPGYELVVDKVGPKLKEVSPAPNNNSDALPDPKAFMNAPPGADGFPDIPGPRTMGLGGRGGLEKTKYQERTMAEFVSNLGFLIGNSQGKGVLQGFPQPRVVDKTGLTGKYTFILEYYSAGTAALMANLPRRPDSEVGNGPAAAAQDPDGGGPNLFTAIQKQLGLRLDKTADIPLEMIVIDSIDKLPTEN